MLDKNNTFVIFVKKKYIQKRTHTGEKPYVYISSTVKILARISNLKSRIRIHGRLQQSNTHINFAKKRLLKMIP